MRITEHMFICRAGKHDFNYYFMTDKCPTEATETPEKTSDVFSYIPVVDRDSEIIYRNILCADCHGTGKVSPWAPKVVCYSTLMNPLNESPFPNTATELLATDLIDYHCHIHYTSPINGEVSSCSVDSLIDSCNVTGEWQSFSLTLVRACEQPFYSPLKREFKNIFCAVCNWQVVPLIDGCIDYGDGSEDTGYVYTAILDFNFEENDESASTDEQMDGDTGCRTDQTMDPYKVRLDETEFQDFNGTRITVLASKKTLFLGEYFKTRFVTEIQNGTEFVIRAQLCTEDYLSARQLDRRPCHHDNNSLYSSFFILSITGAVLLVVIVSVVFIPIFLRSRNQQQCSSNPFRNRNRNTEVDVQTLRTLLKTRDKRRIDGENVCTDNTNSHL